MKYSKLQFILFFVASVALGGCYINGMFGATFRNVWGTETVQPRTFASPSNAKELIGWVATARNDGRRIRMTGSGHSPSDVAVNDDILLYPQKLAGLLPLNREELKEPNLATIARVKSGSTIRDLNRQFDKLNLAFPNLGGWDEQTIAGVAMTATHGSGLNYGPIESIIASIQVVNGEGEMLQIEPTNGITDSAKFSGHLTEDVDIPVQLIQDDKVFQAMKVSIGSMGIVYAYILNLEPKFWITENRVMSTWSEITASDGYLTRIINGKPLNPGGKEPDYYEIQVNPYPVARSGDHNVLLTQRWKSYTPLPVDSTRATSGADLLQFLAVAFQPVVEGAVNLYPDLAVNTLDQALRTQVDESYINISYKVFNIGLINKTDVIAIEIALPLDEIVAATERHFEIVASLYKQGIVQSAPVALRFVKSSDSQISMTQGRSSAILEIINLQGLRNVRTFFRSVQTALMTEFNGRPHWGLDLGYLQGEAAARAIYPRWDEWKQIYSEFNASGIFNGKVTDRLGISINP